MGADVLVSRRSCSERPRQRGCSGLGDCFWRARCGHVQRNCPHALRIARERQRAISFLEKFGERLKGGVLSAVRKVGIRRRQPAPRGLSPPLEIRKAHLAERCARRRARPAEPIAIRARGGDRMANPRPRAGSTQ